MTRRRDDIVRRLLGADPWEGFDPAGWVDLTDKWDSHHPIFDAAVSELRPSVIVEVGAFLGCSSRHFAGLLKAAGTDSVIVSVDTWLAEEVLYGVAEWREKLRFEHGRPQVYRTWLANAAAAGLTAWMCPLSMDSTNAARYLNHQGVAADLVYIDGSHMAGDVHRDLTLYFDLVLRAGGQMIIDDYQHTPDFAGVVDDTNRFARERGLALEVSPINFKARLRKGA